MSEMACLRVGRPCQVALVGGSAWFRKIKYGDRSILIVLDVIQSLLVRLYQKIWRIIFAV